MDNLQSIKDEEVRRDVEVLSARLYDLRERFTKILHEIRHDVNDFDDNILDKDDMSEGKSDRDSSIDEEEKHSTITSNQGSDEDVEEENGISDENETKKSKIRSEIKKLVIKSILERKARRYAYIKHVITYPKIMKYILNDDSNCMNIQLRHLEPFIKEYVNKTPNGRHYDEVNQLIQDIRRKYLKYR